MPDRGERLALVALAVEIRHAHAAQAEGRYLESRAESSRFQSVLLSLPVGRTP
jgi:hypothetical protein